MLWDTAGQEEFDALTKAYYRGAQVTGRTSSEIWSPYHYLCYHHLPCPHFHNHHPYHHHHCHITISPPPSTSATHGPKQTLPHISDPHQPCVDPLIIIYCNTLVLCCDVLCLFLFSFQFCNFAMLQACVVAFSTTDRASLSAVRKWRKKVGWDILLQRAWR